MKAYMGIDQYGETYHLGYTRSPRKDLLERLCRKSAQRIYRDRKNGTGRHVGWLIAGRWIEVFQVTPMND